MTPQTAFRSDDRFTQEEFLAWVDERPSSDINHYELIQGRIVMTPPAGWPHASIEARLVHRLQSFVEPRRLGIVLGSSAGYDLPSGDTVEPDVSYLTTERFSAGPAPVSGSFLRIVPSLVVEILSEATARRDRTEKKSIYQQNGVDEYWIVDVKQRTVTVFGLQRGVYGEGQSFASGAVSSTALGGFAVAIDDLFAV